MEMRSDAESTVPSQPHALTINLYPSSQQMGKAFTDMVAFYGWTEVLVVYGSQQDHTATEVAAPPDHTATEVAAPPDHTTTEVAALPQVLIPLISVANMSKTGLSRVQGVLRGDFGTLNEIIVRNADSNNMRRILKEAKTKRWRRMLIDLPVDETTLFLKMDIESIDMEDFRHNYVNLTGFRLVDPSDPQVKKIIQDMEIYEMQSDLSLLNTTGYLSLPHEVALMYDSVYLLANALERYATSAILRPLNSSCSTPAPWQSGPSLYSFLNQVPMKGLTGDVILKTGSRIDFKLDIMQLTHRGLIKAGEWRVSSGINISYHDNHNSGNPFGNKTLVVTSLKESPFLMDRENPTLDEPYEGFCIDLTKELARIVGFNFRIELVPDGNYGSPNAHGEWDGMVREIIDRVSGLVTLVSVWSSRADLAIAPLTITYLREQVIDFTKPFLNLGISILFKVPRKEKPGLFSFLNPLAIEIWLYVIGAYLIVSFTIFTLARFSPYEWYNPHPCNPNTDVVENTFNLSNSLWFTVGTLMQQGSDINPRAVSTRLVGGIWWFFTLIIISSYTANLAAFLTVERMVSPIESAEDLAKQTEIEYGTRVSSSTLSFFKTDRQNGDNMVGAFSDSVVGAFSDSVVGAFSDSVVGAFCDSVVGAFSDSVVGAFSDSVVGAFSDSVVGAFSDSVVGAFSDSVDGVFSDSVVGVFSDSVVGVFSDSVVDIFSDSVVDVFSDSVVDVFSDSVVGAFSDSVVGVISDSVVGVFSDSVVDVFSDTVVETP
ncbi:Glutamate receptor ionotropic, kainate 1 [Bulinus truncatus]|nr:Glutamate receptor ionotropic, kainate 1 [Bulinus truncatus]